MLKELSVTHTFASQATAYGLSLYLLSQVLCRPGRQAEKPLSAALGRDTGAPSFQHLLHRPCSAC